MNDANASQIIVELKLVSGKLTALTNAIKKLQEAFDQAADQK
jgi:hypothetical protein